MIELWIGIVLSLIASGFFSGAEMAFVSLDTLVLKKRVQKKDLAVDRMQRIMRKPTMFISSALIGNNVALVVATSFATILVGHLFPGLSNVRIQIVVVGMLTPVIVIFCEIIPKSCGVIYAEVVCRKIGGIILAFMHFCMPLIMALNAVTKFLLRPFIHLKQTKRAMITRQELRQVFNEGARGGTIHQRKKRIIDRVFDVKHKCIKDQMLPMAYVSKIDASDSIEHLKSLARKTTHSRFIVHEKMSGDILGYVNIFDVLFDAEADSRIVDFVRTPLFMKDTATLQEALSVLFDRKEWVLFGLDPQDNVSGLLTIKHVLNF